MKSHLPLSQNHLNLRISVSHSPDATFGLKADSVMAKPPDNRKGFLTVRPKAITILEIFGKNLSAVRSLCRLKDQRILKGKRMLLMHSNCCRIIMSGIDKAIMLHLDLE